MVELLGVVVSFDLDMSKLDIYFDGGQNNRSSAYSKIRRFLVQNGYEALGDSDYKNDDDTLNIAINKIKRLCQIEKWFPLCLEKVIITPDSLYCNYTDIFEDEIDQDYKKERESKFGIDN